MPFAIFPFHLCKVLRLPRKIISANLKIWCSKMQPFSGNQRPDLLTSLMNMSLVFSCAAPATRNASFQILFKCPTPAIVFWKCHKTLTFCPLLARWRIPYACHAKTTSELSKVVRAFIFTFWLGNVLRPTTACTFSTSQLPKVLRTWCVLCILTSTCASRHSGVHFFDMSTSKSGTNVRCFLHFDFEMYFAPERRALFSTSQLPKVLRAWCVLYILTPYAFRATTACNFSSLHGASKHWKNTVFRDFSTYLCTCIFFLLTSFSCLILSLLLFSSLTLLTSALTICPYCRKFDF